MPNAAPSKPKGPWFLRFLIRFFTVVLAVLVFWVLGFLVEDIQSIQGPQYDKVEKEYVDQKLLGTLEKLSRDISTAEREIKNKRDEMQIVKDSSQNLQKTIGQLIQLQKLSLEKSVPLPEADQSNLSESNTQFLKSQKQYQDLNSEFFVLSEQRRTLNEEKRLTSEKIEAQRKPAREKYNSLRRKHNLRLAWLQLLILIPLLGIGIVLVLKKRGSVYFPLFLGYTGAALLKVALVIHTYFPSRYFKYILILGLLAAVVRLLVYFIRIVAFPKAEWLARQYREAYERFLCPVCEYPIRTGPRKFLYWTRRTVNKHVVPQDTPAGEEAYSCPACGTALFEECPACHGLRHALLPHCQHCNASKPIAAVADDDESPSPNAE